jgi:hypothetical protein
MNSISVPPLVNVYVLVDDWYQMHAGEYRKGGLESDRSW